MIVFRNNSLNCPSFPNASCSSPATPAPPLQPSTLKHAAVVELILGEPEIHEFKPSRFPDYVHANTLGGQSALTKYRAFSTWVFRLP